MKCTLLSVDSVRVFADDPELLRRLYSIVRLGNWQSDFILHYTELIKAKLDAIDDSDFGSMASTVTELYVQSKTAICGSCDGLPELLHSVHSAVGSYLHNHQFSHQLCIFIHRRNDPTPFLPVIGPFLLSDSSFEETYSRFLSSRLLANANPEWERSLIDQFEALGLTLGKPSQMLNDLLHAPRSPGLVREAAIDLILLDSSFWPTFDPPNFVPPPLFQHLFDMAMRDLIPELKSQRKTARLTTLGSTVEFSDGTTTFSLPFLQACVVQLILERGPQLPSELSAQLALKGDELEALIAELTRRQIVAIANGRLAFVGPPEASLDEEGLPGAPRRPPEDPVLFTNINEPIEAAIVKFLKPRRFASFEDIKGGVYEIVPRHFPVTDDQIQAAIQRLISRCILTGHPGRGDWYRYCKS
jgi:hypothetical protein